MFGWCNKYGLETWLRLFFIGRLRWFDARLLVFDAISTGWVWIGERVLNLNVWGYKIFRDGYLLVVSNTEWLMAQLLKNVIDKTVHYLHTLAQNSKLEMNFLNHLKVETLFGCTPCINVFHLVDTKLNFKNNMFSFCAISTGWEFE